MDEPDFDVVVIGGGAAGLSAGIALCRSRRSVAVVDAGHPRNAPAAEVHNFLTRDGTPPVELLATARGEFAGYGGKLYEIEATGARRAAATFVVELADGRALRARRVLITTGLRDDLPDVPGVRERWGRDVLHCPYCHGWEVRDQQVVVLGTGPAALHQALLFRQLTDTVTLCLLDGVALHDEQREQLAARGVPVHSAGVTELVVTDDRVTGVRLGDGTVVPAQAVVVAPRFVANSTVAAALGVEVREHESGAGEHVVVEATGATSVPGVYAAGNVANLQAQVITAASEGLFAGAMINVDLVAEEAARAVAVHKQGVSA